MYPAIRVVLVLIPVALAALPAFLAYRVISANSTVLKSWTRTQGVVVSLAADDYVQVELGSGVDATRVNAPVVHKVGLSFLKKVPLFVDPADPARARVGGLFQMWLWPAGLAAAALVFLALAGTASVIGRSQPAAAETEGRWMFSTPPPAMQTDIHVHRPASEWKAPLFWSILGAVALAMSLLFRSGPPIQRLGLGGAGLIFLLLMFALSLATKTTDISADSHGLRKTTAFGWCQVPWEQVGRVEEQQTIFGRDRSLLGRRSSDTFPGRNVKSIVFADRSGRTLISMSVAMQPPEMTRRLLDLCAARTGLRLEFRKIYEPNL